MKWNIKICLSYHYHWLSQKSTENKQGKQTKYRKIRLAKYAMFIRDVFYERKMHAWGVPMCISASTMCMHTVCSRHACLLEPLLNKACIRLQLPWLMRYWTVQRWPTRAAFITAVRPPSASCSCHIVNTESLTESSPTSRSTHNSSFHGQFLQAITCTGTDNKNHLTAD